MKFFRISSLDNQKIVCKKFEKLIALKKLMTKYEEVDLRPHCEEILNVKKDWYLGLHEFKEEINFRQILSKDTIIYSIDESFAKYFIRQKLEVLHKAFSVLKNNFSSAILLELQQIFEPMGLNCD